MRSARVRAAQRKRDMNMKHVLVVDDDMATLFAYQKLFRQYSVAFTACGTLEKALQLITEVPFDAVITDLRLSGEEREEGLDILRCVQILWPDTKAILVTAHSSDEVREKAFSLGASFYFEKPVHVADMFDALRKLNIIEEDRTGGAQYADAVG